MSWMIARGNPKAHFLVKDGQAACGFYRRRGHGWQRPWMDGDPRCRLCEEVLTWLPGKRENYASEVSGLEPP
jgi:hypothetical protein